MPDDKLSAILISSNEKLRAQVPNFLKKLGFAIAGDDKIDAVCHGETVVPVLVVDEETRADECWTIHRRNPKTKIIRITNDWPDEKNYRWLRDIAGVSTQLLMPLNEKFFSVAIFNGVNGAQVDAAEPTIGTKGGIKETSELPSVPNDVRDLQTRLRAEVLLEWEKFEQFVKALTDHRIPTNEEAASLIKTIHKIRGSSGLLNLVKLSLCAARIEDWLKLFIPCTEPDMVLLISSIKKQIAVARSVLEIQETIPQSFQSGPTPESEGPPIVVLAVGESEEQIREIESLLQGRNVELYALTIPVNVLDEVELLSPHLIFVNSSLSSVSVFDLCRNLRTHSGSKRTAIACLMPIANQSFEASDLPSGIFCIRKPQDGIDEREWEMYLSGLKPR